MSLPHEVLRHFYSRFPGDLIPLGNCGGFSGAKLWRLDGPAGSFCLRRWPDGVPSSYLTTVNRLLDLARDLDFVPRVMRSDSGVHFVAHSARFWELTTWMPGRADFREQPTRSRLQAACAALAEIHRAWAGHEPREDICPAIERRLFALRQWNELWQAGWRPRLDDADPVTPSARRALAVLAARLDELPGLLQPWLRRTLPLHACLCDIWHDHVLFTGDRVTGIVDYGSVKWDHPAVDLARLLGSMVGDDVEAQACGLRAYCGVRPVACDFAELVRIFDRSGTVLGTANWLRWLYHEQREYADRAAIARRLSQLISRMEAW